MLQVVHQSSIYEGPGIKQVVQTDMEGFPLIVTEDRNQKYEVEQPCRTITHQLV